RGSRDRTAPPAPSPAPPRRFPPRRWRTRRRDGAARRATGAGPRRRRQEEAVLPATFLVPLEVPNIYRSRSSAGNKFGRDPPYDAARQFSDSDPGRGTGGGGPPARPHR